MAARVKDICPLDEQNEVEPTSPGMVVKRDENNGVIPRWLFPSLVTILGFLLLQLIGFVWWAATMTERMNNIMTMGQRDAAEYLRRLEATEQKIEVHTLQINRLDKGDGDGRSTVRERNSR